MKKLSLSTDNNYSIIACYEFLKESFKNKLRVVEGD